MVEKEFYPELGVVKTDTFSRVYPEINHYIMENEKWKESRDGCVKELLDFKTIITNPYRRLVGGFGRNINPFFLFAEAMWIFTGRKDVKFLTMFNKSMENFSDDGKVFHAPYGFRLRHWGVRSEDKFCEENIHAAQGYDQIDDAIRLLHSNPNTRQVVLSIWNPDFDLGCKTKDIPCNDVVMLKIRDGKLITTIQNRSNDLHWGLPTNVFQFSFLTECIAACLGIELGTQTHNSQSLHVYEWNDIATTMFEGFENCEATELYSNGAKEYKIDFHFSHDVPGNRLRELDYILNLIIFNLERVGDGKDEVYEEVAHIGEFSQYLYEVYCCLKVYLQYKKSTEDRKESTKKAFDEISSVCKMEKSDFFMLCLNWFAKRNPELSNNLIGKM